MWDYLFNTQLNDPLRTKSLPASNIFKEIELFRSSRTHTCPLTTSCHQTTRSHGNLKGIRFHVIADFHFQARQVDGGLVLISSPDEVDDICMDEERRAQGSEEATTAKMAIAKLDRLNVTTSAARSSEFGQQGCCICFEDFDEAVEDLDLARLPCCHVFHYHCIVQWLERSQVCPLCRHQVK